MAVKTHRMPQPRPRTPRKGGMPHMLGRHMSMDGLTNLVTGMGTDKDKLRHTMFGYEQMPREQLDAAYRSDWIARKAIDIPAADATREWRSWQADQDQVEEVENEEKRLGLRRKTKLGMQWGRLYGGAAIIMGVDGQGNNDQELDPEKVGEGDLKFIHVVNRFELYSDTGMLVNDISSPYYGEPEMYRRTDPSGMGKDLLVHPSRVIRFIGAEAPDPIYSEGWGDSVLGVIADAVLSAGTVTNSIAQLMQEAKMDIVSIPRFSEKIASTKYADLIRSRFANASMMKSVFNTLLVDKEEEWDRIAVNFQGMDDILRMYLMIVCAAVDVPATRFLSQSPTGMSATGESDLRNYYDKCANDQDTEVSPKLDRLDAVMIRSLGIDPDQIFYNWNPLWQLTPTESATIAVQKAQVMTADVNAALLSPQVLQHARLNQLIEDGTYPGLDQINEEYGDDIDERQAEEAAQAAEAAAQAAAAAGVDPAAAGAGGVGSDGKPLKGAAAANGSKKPPGKAANSSKKALPGGRAASADAMFAALQQTMADRVAGRTPTFDASSPPQSLYLSRPVKNMSEIRKWAKSQGFRSTIPDLHVTIIYSKGALDWLKAGGDEWGGSDDNGNLTIKAGGPRVMQQFGKAVVLSFSSSALAWRHQDIMRIEGATYDFEEYTPHITISYTGFTGDIRNIEPYAGDIVLGPEVWAQIDEDGFDPDKLVEVTTTDGKVKSHMLALDWQK